MAVVSITENAEGRSGDLTMSQSSGTRTYRRVFRVTTDNKLDNAAVVAAYGGIPQLGSTYPLDGGAYCRSITHENFEPPFQWLATCDYSSEFAFYPNPLDDPAIITWSSDQYQKPVWKTRYNEPIMNSAGRFFDTLPEADDSRLSCTVQKNLASVPAWILAYNDALNSSTFTIDGLTIPVQTSKLSGVAIGPREDRNSIEYRVLSYTLHFRAEGWDLEVLDRGRARRGSIASGGVVGDPAEDPKEMHKAVNDGDHTDADEPVLLDGFGRQLKEPWVSLGVFLKFPVYKILDFNLIPLS